MRMPAKLAQSFRALPLICFAAPAAHAQLSGSAAILSDYMYRGISFSAGKPVARLALNYDGAAGWYAGGQLVNGQMNGETQRSAQWLGYAGYARRLASGLSWETGVTAYGFPSVPNWNFREFHVGVANESYSARLHYSPDYLGLGERTLYAEVNGGQALTERLQLFWHAGYLYAPSNAASNRAEGRAGVSAMLQGWQAQLSLDMVRLRQSGAIYGASSDNNIRHKFVVSIARTF